MKRIVIGSALAAGLTLVACESDTPTPMTDEEVASVEQAAIYGEDSRREYYNHPDDAVRELTANSIIALVQPRSMDTSNPNDIQFRGGTLGQSYGLCEGELFRDQPTVANCSATLIDDDLVLTAGHCVESQGSCENWAFVFGYYYVADGELNTVTQEDVFYCDELLVQLQTSGREDLDYAILRLDRPATPRFEPAPVNPETLPVNNGDALTMIGFGSGIPAKLDTGGEVIDARSSNGDYFLATVDAFGGNSGSGVFDDDGNVVGILVAGNQDYSRSGGCTVATTYPENGGGSFGGEIVTYASVAVQELCESGYPSERLCDVEVVCGDGFCASSENEIDCPEDCAPVCGDGVCEDGELETCPDDCASGVVPDDWRCPDEYYAAEDGCDCGCGAYDPDCDDPSQEILNCGPDEFCNDEGVCEFEDVEEPELPEDWRCPERFYDDGEECDCACGAPDPDCDIEGAPVLNCRPGEICSDEGLCIEGEEPEPEPEPGDDTGISDDTGTDDPTDAGTSADGSANGFGEYLGDGPTGTGSTGCSAAAPAMPLAWMLALVVPALRRRRR